MVLEFLLQLPLVWLSRLLFRLRLWVAPTLALQEQLMGYRQSALLSLMARLRIAERLAEGPRTARELLPEGFSNLDSFRRFLELMVSLGLLRPHPPEHYALTRRGRHFIPGSPGSVHGAAIYWGHLSYQAYLGLEEHLRSGRASFESVFGRPFHEYVGEHEELSSYYTRVQTWPARAYAAVAGALELEGASKVVDLGGARGDLVAALLSRHPGLTGVLLELPAYNDEAQRHLRERGVASRCQFVAGSFFEPLPAGDTYCVMRVLNNWTDEGARRLLGNVQRALPAQGRLFVIDVMPARRDVQVALMDASNLAHVNGKFRTEPEMVALVEGAGFQLTRRRRVRSLGFGLMVLEFRAASRGPG